MTEVVVYERPGSLVEVAKFRGPSAMRDADAYFSAEAKAGNHIDADCVAVNNILMLGWDEWDEKLLRSKKKGKRA